VEVAGVVVAAGRRFTVDPVVAAAPVDSEHVSAPHVCVSIAVQVRPARCTTRHDVQRTVEVVCELGARLVG
jgi:hypothetical protein